MRPAILLVAVVAVIAATTACSKPGFFDQTLTSPSVTTNTPTPTPAPNNPPPRWPDYPAGPRMTLTGTVYLRGAGGTVPLDDGTIFGWVKMPSLSRTTGAVPFENGHYSMEVPVGAGVSLSVSGYRYRQPCVASVTVTPDTSRLDVTVINGPALLGRDVPLDVINGTRTLSGTVFTVGADGNHQPVQDAVIWLDGAGGLGVSLATTVSGSDGGYLLCGLSEEPGAEAVLNVTKAGYSDKWVTTPLVGHDMTLDVELPKE